MFLKDCMRTTLVATVRNYNSGMRLGYGLQVMMKIWNECMRAAGLEELRDWL